MWAELAGFRLSLLGLESWNLPFASADESGDEESVSQTDKTELQNTLRTLTSKVEDLSTCNDLIAKHGTALQRSLSELESLRLPAESSEKIKQVNERATLFRITSNAMINVSAGVLCCIGVLSLSQHVILPKCWEVVLTKHRALGPALLLRGLRLHCLSQETERDAQMEWLSYPAQMIRGTLPLPAMLRAPSDCSGL